MQKHNVPVYRLTTRDHLYALADIQAIEELARCKAPKPTPTNMELFLSRNPRKQKKEVVAK